MERNLPRAAASRQNVLPRSHAPRGNALQGRSASRFPTRPMLGGMHLSLSSPKTYALRARHACRASRHAFPRRSVGTERFGLYNDCMRIFSSPRDNTQVPIDRARPLHHEYLHRTHQSAAIAARKHYRPRPSGDVGDVATQVVPDRGRRLSVECFCPLFAEAACLTARSRICETLIELTTSPRRSKTPSFIAAAVSDFRRPPASLRVDRPIRTFRRPGEACRTAAWSRCSIEAAAGKVKSDEPEL